MHPQLPQQLPANIPISKFIKLPAFRSFCKNRTSFPMQGDHVAKSNIKQQFINGPFTAILRPIKLSEGAILLPSNGPSYRVNYSDSPVRPAIDGSSKKCSFYWTLNYLECVPR